MTPQKLLIWIVIIVIIIGLLASYGATAFTL